MPSKSKKQARLMAAVAHNPKFAKKVGIPQSVGREFNDADRKLRKYAEGGKVKNVRRFSEQMARLAPQFVLNARGKPINNTKKYDKVIRDIGWDPEMGEGDFFELSQSGVFPYHHPAHKALLNRLMERYGMEPKSRLPVMLRGFDMEVPEEGLREGYQFEGDMPVTTTLSPRVARNYAMGVSKGEEGATPIILSIDPGKGLRVLPRPTLLQDELVLPEDTILEIIEDTGAIDDQKLTRLKARARRKNQEYAEGGKVGQLSKLLERAKELEVLDLDLTPHIEGSGEARRTLAKVLKNPTPEELSRYAGREIPSVRVMTDTQGNTYAWDSREAIHDWVLRALNMSWDDVVRASEDTPIRTRDYEQWLQGPKKSEYADGGRVLPSSTDDEESWSDTYIKRPLSGLVAMWGGSDPETGEFINPVLHNLRRSWNLDERRRRGLPDEPRANLGIVDETIALPGLGGIVGLPVPEFAEEAEERSSATREAARGALGLDAPHGFTENLAESAGVMAGQLPVPASVANRLKLLKTSGKLGKAGKVLGPAAEWFSPTVVPKAGNYLKGTLFGGTLGGGLDYLGDYLDEKEQEERNQQFISEAIAEVLEEERILKAQESGSEETDDEALAELGYAEGGKVSAARKALTSLRDTLDAPEEDKTLRQAKIDEALRKITTPGSVELPKTIRAGLNEQRTDPGIRALVDRALPLLQPSRPIEDFDPKSIVSNLPPVANPKVDESSARGLLTDEEYERELGALKYAEGGAVNNPWESPQSQKNPEARAAGAQDPRGAPLSQEWYENYGAGPEHLFLGDRTIKLHDYWGPQHPGAVPPVQQQPQGSWLPAAGIIGFSLYDEWKNRRGQGEDTSQVAFWEDMHQSAADTSDTDAWVNSQLDQYGSDAPMPVVNDDGSVSYVQPNQFWRDMHQSAIDTSSTDSWVNSQLEDYANDMAMPVMNDDGTISYVDRDGNPIEPGDEGFSLGRAWQGLGGAYGLYSGLQQGDTEGYIGAVQGAADIYGALTGRGSGLGLLDTYSGIQQGGVEGYTQAAGGALQAANTLGVNTGAAGAALGTAATGIGALYSAYGAYESARVGDKKGAVAQGAAAGAAIGSVIPVIGTAVGAVIGAAVGLVGASLGDKQQASEAYYGAHKDLDPDKQIRGWSEDQVNGAVFETIKSHTKSGNINKFKDVGEMYTAFGITKDAHKNYKNVQTQMGDFMKGAIETAQQMGALPTDPTELRQLDGQQIYYKVIVPALAAKYEEQTGKKAEGWTEEAITKDSKMHNLFADWADWMTSHWGSQGRAAAPPDDYGLDSAMGNASSGRAVRHARGGRVGNMFDYNPRSGALSLVS